MKKKKKKRPNWARKVRELILFNVLCTVYCGRSCLSLESEGKEIMRGWVNFCCGQRATDGTETRGVLRGPREPKKSDGSLHFACGNIGWAALCWLVLLLKPSKLGFPPHVMHLVHRNLSHVYETLEKYTPLLLRMSGLMQSIRVLLLSHAPLLPPLPEHGPAEVAALSYKLHKWSWKI